MEGHTSTELHCNNPQRSTYISLLSNLSCKSSTLTDFARDVARVSDLYNFDESGCSLCQLKLLQHEGLCYSLCAAVARGLQLLQTACQHSTVLSPSSTRTAAYESICMLLEALVRSHWLWARTADVTDGTVDVVMLKLATEIAASGHVAEYVLRFLSDYTHYILAAGLLPSTAAACPVLTEHIQQQQELISATAGLHLPYQISTCICSFVSCLIAIWPGKVIGGQTLGVVIAPAAELAVAVVKAWPPLTCGGSSSSRHTTVSVAGASAVCPEQQQQQSCRPLCSGQTLLVVSRLAFNVVAILDKEAVSLSSDTPYWDQMPPATLLLQSDGIQWLLLLALAFMAEHIYMQAYQQPPAAAAPTSLAAPGMGLNSHKAHQLQIDQQPQQSEDSCIAAAVSADSWYCPDKYHTDGFAGSGIVMSRGPYSKSEILQWFEAGFSDLEYPIWVIDAGRHADSGRRHTQIAGSSSSSSSSSGGVTDKLTSFRIHLGSLVEVWAASEPVDRQQQLMQRLQHLQQQQQRYCPPLYQWLFEALGLPAYAPFIPLDGNGMVPAAATAEAAAAAPRGDAAAAALRNSAAGSISSSQINPRLMLQALLVLHTTFGQLTHNVGGAHSSSSSSSSSNSSSSNSEDGMSDHPSGTSPQQQNIVQVSLAEQVLGGALCLPVLICLVSIATVAQDPGVVSNALYQMHLRFRFWLRQQRSNSAAALHASREATAAAAAVGVCFSSSRCCLICTEAPAFVEAVVSTLLLAVHTHAQQQQQQQAAGADEARAVVAGDSSSDDCVPNYADVLEEVIVVLQVLGGADLACLTHTLLTTLTTTGPLFEWLLRLGAVKDWSTTDNDMSDMISKWYGMILGPWCDYDMFEVSWQQLVAPETAAATDEEEEVEQRTPPAAAAAAEAASGIAASIPSAAAAVGAVEADEDCPQVLLFSLLTSFLKVLSLIKENESADLEQVIGPALHVACIAGIAADVQQQVALKFDKLLFETGSSSGCAAVVRMWVVLAARALLVVSQVLEGMSARLTAAPVTAAAATETAVNGSNSSSGLEPAAAAAAVDGPGAQHHLGPSLVTQGNLWRPLLLLIGSVGGHANGLLLDDQVPQHQRQHQQGTPDPAIAAAAAAADAVRLRLSEMLDDLVTAVNVAVMQAKISEQRHRDRSAAAFDIIAAPAAEEPWGMPADELCQYQQRQQQQQQQQPKTCEVRASTAAMVARQLKLYTESLLAEFPVSLCCANPECINLSCESELFVVRGRSCVCGGCLTARYCSRTCQKKHYKQHKQYCKRRRQQQAAAAQGS